MWVQCYPLKGQVEHRLDEKRGTFFELEVGNKVDNKVDNKERNNTDNKEEMATKKSKIKLKK